MNDDEDEIAIPISHFVVRENSSLMDKLALAYVKNHWDENKLREWFEQRGYSPQTVARFSKGVLLRINGVKNQTSSKRSKKKQEQDDSGEKPTDSRGNHYNSQKDADEADKMYAEASEK